MSRSGVTFEQVAQSAEGLMKAGQQPTIRAIRELLGDTGSPNTIQKHLSKWRDAQQIVATAPELPQILIAAMTTELKKAAAQAKSEMEGQFIQAKNEATELATLGETLEAERDAFSAQVALLTSERDTLSGKASQQAEELMKQAERLEREQQAAELARAELVKAKLTAENHMEMVKAQTVKIDHLQTTLEAESKLRVSAEQQAAVLTAKLEAMTDRATKAEARNDVLEKRRS